MFALLSICKTRVTNHKLHKKNIFIMNQSPNANVPDAGLRSTYHQIFLTAVLSVGLFACTRDESPLNNKSNTMEVDNILQKDADEAAGNSAAAQIAASEKLDIPEMVSVPANLPEGNRRVATYYAVGVQKYKAREKAGSNPVSYEWVFVAPQAELFDSANAVAGIHGAGPFWTLSVADSIFAQHFIPAKTAPATDPESIDWLLLMPKAGTTPTGVFTDVDYIQRIATKGGKAPLTPPVNANQTVEVKYKAVYRFTAKNP
jgi:hypothetical protein